MSGSPVTSGLAAKRASSVASGTSNSASSRIAWSQNATSRGVSVDAGQAEVGLEPLALRVDQRDQRDRHAAQLRGGARDGVERGLGQRVEHAQLAQRGEAARLVERRRRVHWTSPTARGVDAMQRRRIDRAQHVDARARAAGGARGPARLALHRGDERLVEAHAVVLVVHRRRRPARAAGAGARPAARAPRRARPGWRAARAAARAAAARRRPRGARAPARARDEVEVLRVHARAGEGDGVAAERQRGRRGQRLPDRDGVDVARLAAPATSLSGARPTTVTVRRVDVVEDEPVVEEVLRRAAQHRADALAADLRRLGDLRAAPRHQLDLVRRRADRGDDREVAMRRAAGGHQQLGGGGDVDLCRRPATGSTRGRWRIRAGAGRGPRP